MKKNKLFKVFLSIGFSLCMMFTVTNVFAATVSKTKSASLTTTNGYKVIAKETAKKTQLVGHGH